MIWWLTLAHAGIRIEAPPVERQETVILVTDELGDPRPGETVRVIHRPGLAGERERAVGITDGRGRVRWTPEQPGIAELQAGDEPLRIRVAWARVPVATWLLLGLLACGGVAALVVGTRR